MVSLWKGLLKYHLIKEVKAFGREAVEEPQKPEETKNPPGGLGFALTTALNEMGGQGK